MTAKSRDNPAKILIVDDLEVNVGILENIIRSEGYEPLCALSVQEALEIMNRTMPQLILSDYYMPEVDGLQFCKLLKKNPKTRDIPFMFITVADSSEDKRNAFEAGAVDYIPKPFERVEVAMRVQNQLNSYRAKQEIEENNRMMHRIITEQKKLVEKEQKNLLVALSSLVKRRYGDMGNHLECIGYNSRILAQSLQLSEKYEQEINDEFVDIICIAAKLQDLGALVVDCHRDFGRHANVDCSDAEYIDMHTREGAAFFEEISSHSTMSRFLDMAYFITKYHHAHWDGTGYPRGVGGTDIPLVARIVKLANDFDMELRTADGQDADLEQVKQRISERSGTVYEPFIVEVFMKVIKQLKKPL